MEVNLLPGEVDSFNFQVATFYPVLSANFTVTVQSVDYAIEGEFNGVVIPEFQSFLILPLFMAITLLAVLGDKKRVACATAMPSPSEPGSNQRV
jgi:hypothetical protein